jgi:primosomal protein N' (replication factor Y)
LVDVLGPAAAPIARLRGRYRFRILVRAEQRSALRAVLRLVAARMRKLEDRRTRIVIDVDPVSML